MPVDSGHHREQPSVHKEESTQQEVLVKPWVSPEVDILNACLDEGALWGGPIKGFSPVKIQQIVDKSRFHQEHTEEQESRDSIVKEKNDITTEFNWERYGKMQMGYAIGFINKLGIFDKQTMMHALKVASTKNTHLENNLFSGWFDPESYVNYLDDQGHDMTTPLPLPQTKQMRNEHIKIRLGYDALVGGMLSSISQFEKEEVDVDPNDAFMISTIGLAAHEFAHAIQFALQARGTPEYKNVHKTPNSFLKDVRMNSSHVQAEHFARGVELLVVEKLLREGLLYDHDLVTALMNNKKNHFQTQDKAFEALFKKAEDKGLEMEEFFYRVWDIQEKMYPRTGHFVEQGEEVPVGNLEHLIAYQASPYTEEELKMLVA